jgi:pre-mRNA-splicing factor SYF2
MTNQFSIQDYHNPEGQHRNYQRDLSSLPKLQDYAGDVTATYNPIMGAADSNQQAQGAKQLALELKRRHEKQAKKREAQEFEGSDVSYINQRNKRFNQKISRNYDESTAEIKQNLERGTAL